MTDTLLTSATSIQPEDLVMACYPMGEKTNNPAHKYDGEQFVVKSKRRQTARPRQLFPKWNKLERGSDGK